MLFLVYALWVGVLNCGAGRNFFGLINSTQLGRIIFAVGAGLPLIPFMEAWQVIGIIIGLFLWRLPSWGEFFPAVHGRKEKHKLTVFSKVADKIWSIEPTTPMEVKLKATLGMAVRMSLIVPAVLLSGNPLHALLFPLLATTYFTMGFLGEQKAVERAEFLNGIIIAGMLWGI